MVISLPEKIGFLPLEMGQNSRSASLFATQWMTQNDPKHEKNAITFFWGTDHITPAILVQKGHTRQKISEITSHFDPKFLGMIKRV